MTEINISGAEQKTKLSSVSKGREWGDVCVERGGGVWLECGLPRGRRVNRGKSKNPVECGLPGGEEGKQGQAKKNCEAPARTW